MASSAALHVLADYVKMLVTLQFLCETNHVEAEPPRVAVEVGQLEMILILEDEIVHLPELPLTRRALCRFGGKESVWMRVLEREMAVCETSLVRKTLQQQLHGGRGLPADRALEIAVLDDRRVSASWAQHVIGAAHGDGEVEWRRHGIHPGQCAPASAHARISAPNCACVPGTGVRPAPGDQPQPTRLSSAM